MSLFGSQRREVTGVGDAGSLIPSRVPRKVGAVSVTNDSALRHSAVWACLRLRSDLVSTFPLDVYRKVDGIQVELPKPPVLVAPGGERWNYSEWMYASQFDLDRTGNTIGLITEVNALGLPARIDLQPIDRCSVVERKGVGLTYRIDGTEYSPEKVWHERQYPVAGLPVGLSPIAYAAWSIGEYLSLQDFALDWFGSGAVPKGRLKNTARTITAEAATLAKERFKASVANGDLFVHGSDWEYDMLQAENQGMEWIEGKRYGVSDVARFFGCPGDLIDAVVSSGSITYASVTQRNLQFLIMHLGPTVSRRENNLSKLLPRPRFVKLNTDALLRMDPQARAQTLRERIAARTLTVSEARALENLPPLTPDQVDEFTTLFGPPGKAGGTPAKSGT